MPWFGGSALALAVLIALLPQTDHDSLIVQCAASQQAPLAAAATAYEQQTGERIELRFGASETLLTNLRITRTGDIFLPADESYIEMARDEGLITETLPVARMTAVLVVAADRPRNIQAWNDLIANQVSIALADPDTAAIGKLTRQQLQRSGHWGTLRRQTAVYNGNVTETANAVAVGSVDAGIVWDAVGRSNPKLRVIALPELASVQANVTVAVASSNSRRDAALRFARFLADPNGGQAHYQHYGFSPASRP